MWNYMWQLTHRSKTAEYCSSFFTYPCHHMQIRPQPVKQNNKAWWVSNIATCCYLTMVRVYSRCLDRFTVSKVVMTTAILLTPKYQTRYKSKVNIPVPLLLFFSVWATCITSAAASLTARSSFCSRRITHLHIARVSDRPAFMDGQKLEFYSRIQRRYRALFPHLETTDAEEHWNMGKSNALANYCENNG